MPYALTPEVRVNSYTQSRQSAAQTIALADGGYVTVWSGAGEADQGYGVFLQRFDATGARIGAEILVNTTTIHSQRNPQIAALASGGYAVVWDQTVPGQAGTQGVFSQAFDAAGGRVGLETQVSASGSQQRVTALPDGGYVVAWTQSSDYPWSGVMGQRFDALGQAQGAPWTLDGDRDASLPSLTTTSAGFIAVWRAWNDNGATVAIQAFGMTGTAIGETLRIPRDNDSTQPEIVRLADGGFAVVWYESSGLHAQILGSDGQPSGGQFLIQAVPAGAQFLHSVAATPDGGFTVAWEQFGGVAPSTIAVASFFADGARNGDVMTIRSGLSTPGEPPALAVLASGDVILTYARYVGDVVNFYDVFQVRLQALAGPTTGTSGDDRLTGTPGPDRLMGFDGDDFLFGSGGDDVLIGGRGNDHLDGGDGWDEAVFSGLASSYKIFQTADGGYQVRGIDGIDVLTNIEQLRFDDQVIDLTLIVCPPLPEAVASDWGWAG